jgi:hypothetical protein
MSSSDDEVPAEAEIRIVEQSVRVYPDFFRE